MSRILSFMILCSALNVSVGASPNHKIWFDQPNSSTEGVAIWRTNDFSATSVNPDQSWESFSLPIGNGSFGATIMGSVARERIVLNEKTLWTGGPATGAETYWNMNRMVPDTVLTLIRSALECGDKSKAGELTSSYFRGTIPYDRTRFGTFTMLGEAYISTGIDENRISDYRRTLDIDESMATVEFDFAGSHYSRSYFASYPDSVMVWRFQSSKIAQNLEFAFATPQEVDRISSMSNLLLIEGHIPGNDMKWAICIGVRTDSKGKVSINPNNSTIRLCDVKDAEFLVAADTDYRMNFDPDPSDPKAFVGEDPMKNVVSIVKHAMTKSYDELQDAHAEDYKMLYNRVSLALNPSEERMDIPTPARLNDYRNGVSDPELEETYYQFGRYLLISSSRQGSMPANLQGLWHNNIDGPWRVDYHNNINLQMNYWPAMSTNLQECFIPFNDYVAGLVSPGERTAQAYYGARGWTAPISTNIFGFTAPLDAGDMTWNYNPSAGPWLAAQLWEYYDYTRDIEWLRKIGYPIIKSSAEFASDLLYNYNGTLTVAPSYSPEHGECDMGATYANAVTREILKVALESAEVLGVDSLQRIEWRETLDSIYPYRIGSHGQLQEWYDDIDDPNDRHRHTNHLFGLHPGTTINPLVNTDLADACRQTLKERGDEATGWSMGWKLNHWARLLDGDHAYTLFRNLLSKGTGPNLWDIHPPFQIDGNFGGTAGVTEMFLQSQHGMIHLLPALPSAWRDGSIHGLLARGNFVVDITFADGHLIEAVVTSRKGGECRVFYNGAEIAFPTKENGVYKIKVANDGSLKVVD